MSSLLYYDRPRTNKNLFTACHCYGERVTRYILVTVWLVIGAIKRHFKKDCLDSEDKFSKKANAAAEIIK